MDPVRFDRLAASLVASGTRRRLLHLLMALPLAGALTTVLDEEGAANRPGQNRRAHNRRHSGHRKANRKKERAEEDDENTDPDQDGPRQRQCVNILSAAGCLALGSRIRWLCAEGTDLTQAALHECNLQGSTMNGVILNNAILNTTQLQNTKFNGAHMHEASMIATNLFGAEFRGADLGGADMRKVRLASLADFTGAALPSAKMQLASLKSAIFQDADLREVVWDDTLCPDGVLTREPIFGPSTCCGHLNGYTTSRCS